jgi:excinuclease UvrABC nuclease subunit
MEWMMVKSDVPLRAPALQVDGTVPYRPSHASAVPMAAGVYLIHDLRGCLYIGRGNVIKIRFDQHYEYSHNRHLRIALRNPVGPIHFSWVLARGEPQRLLEKRLIDELHPLCNEVRYSLKEDNR